MIRLIASICLAVGILMFTQTESQSTELNLKGLPEAGFRHYENCVYSRGSIITAPSPDTSPIFGSWKDRLPTDLTQVNINWACSDGAHGERIFLISCADKKWQMYSGYMQSRAERKKMYYGWMDNYAGSAPTIFNFKKTDAYGVKNLPKEIIKIVCSKH